MKLIQTLVILYLIHVTSGWIRFRYPLSRRNFLQQTAMEMLQNCAGNPVSDDFNTILYSLSVLPIAHNTPNEFLFGFNVNQPVYTILNFHMCS